MDLSTHARKFITWPYMVKQITQDSDRFMSHSRDLVWYDLQIVTYDWVCVINSSLWTNMKHNMCYLVFMLISLLQYKYVTQCVWLSLCVQ